MPPRSSSWLAGLQVGDKAAYREQAGHRHRLLRLSSCGGPDHSRCCSTSPLRIQLPGEPSGHGEPIAAAGGLPAAGRGSGASAHLRRPRRVDRGRGPGPAGRAPRQRHARGAAQGLLIFVSAAGLRSGGSAATAPAKYERAAVPDRQRAEVCAAAGQPGEQGFVPRAPGERGGARMEHAGRRQGRRLHLRPLRPARLLRPVPHQPGAARVPARGRRRSAAHVRGEPLRPLLRADRGQKRARDDRRSREPAAALAGMARAAHDHWRPRGGERRGRVRRAAGPAVPYVLPSQQPREQRLLLAGAQLPRTAGILRLLMTVEPSGRRLFRTCTP